MADLALYTVSVEGFGAILATPDEKKAAVCFKQYRSRVRNDFDPPFAGARVNLFQNGQQIKTYKPKRIRKRSVLNDHWIK